jgi:hypothetical protein
MYALVLTIILVSLIGMGSMELSYRLFKFDKEIRGVFHCIFGALVGTGFLALIGAAIYSFLERIL